MLFSKSSRKCFSISSQNIQKNPQETMIDRIGKKVFCFVSKDLVSQDQYNVKFYLANKHCQNIKTCPPWHARRSF